MNPFHNPRIVVAAAVVTLALLALPALTTAPASAPTPAPTPEQALAQAPTRAADQPAEQAPPTLPAMQDLPTFVVGQAASPSIFQIALGSRVCSLSQLGDQTALTLGDDCQNVSSRLHIPANATVWLGVTIKDLPGVWLPLSTVEGDTAPPQIDQRGRYFGCTRAEGINQVCEVNVEIDATLYRLAVPLMADS